MTVRHWEARSVQRRGLGARSKMHVCFMGLSISTVRGFSHFITRGYILTWCSPPSHQPIPQHLGNSPLRHPLPKRHCTNRPDPRRRRCRRPSTPNLILPPRRRHLSLRSRHRRRRRSRVNTTLRQQRDTVGYERDVLFDAAGDVAGTGAGESEQQFLECGVLAVSAAWSDDGVYG